MEIMLPISILPQPDDITCGPTCLQAVYRYFGLDLDLDQVIREVPVLEGGGTLAVHLGSHALSLGYQATLYTFDLQVFDPTWFPCRRREILEKLSLQMEVKSRTKLHLASLAYMKFLEKGGEILFEDLTADLLRRHLKRSMPILTGLSATYLYKTPRERTVNERMVYDDLRGEPSGHFVVVTGYNAQHRRAQVADPLMPNPISPTPLYEVTMNHLISAIMLGILTYDANLLVIAPKNQTRRNP